MLFMNLRNDSSDKKKSRLLYAVWIVAILFTVLFSSACAQNTDRQRDDNHIRIALVSKAGMEYNVSRYRKGIELAISEYNGPYEVSIEIYGEAVNFEQAVTVNNELAANPDITAVMSMQDYEVIDVSAKSMNEANKSFFIVQGYYDSTAKQQLNSVFPFSLNAAHLGFSMGLYTDIINAEEIACVYSGTQFERSQVYEFDIAAMIHEKEVVSSLSEPFTDLDFENEITAWRALNVDTIYVPYYRSEWAVSIIHAIKAELPAVNLLASFTIGSYVTPETLSMIDGTVLPAYYPIVDSNAYQLWRERYKAAYDEIAENDSAQAYDIMNLILANYDGDNSRLAQNIRNNAEQADGLAGEMIQTYINGLGGIDYSLNNLLPYEYLVVTDGKLISLD